MEMEIAQQLGELGRKETGLEQYAIAKFAEALEVCLHARRMRNRIKQLCTVAYPCSVALCRCVMSMEEPLLRPVTDGVSASLRRCRCLPAAEKC